MEHRNLVWLLDPGTNEPLEPHRVLTDNQTASYTRDHHYRIVLEYRGCSMCPPDRGWHEHPDSDAGDNTLCWVSPPNNRDGLACLLQWRHSAAHVFTRPPTAEGHEDAGPCPWEAYDGETVYACPLYADHTGLHQAQPITKRKAIRG